jgi:hypothetical protein
MVGDKSVKDSRQSGFINPTFRLLKFGILQFLINKNYALKKC